MTKKPQYFDASKSEIRSR